MGTWSREVIGLPTVAQPSGGSPWDGKYEFTMNKTNNTTYSYTLKTWLRLPNGNGAHNDRPATDDKSASLTFAIDAIGHSNYVSGPYTIPISGSNWCLFKELSGTFTVTAPVVIIPRFALWTGWGRSDGKPLYAVDTWNEYICTEQVSGVVASVISNTRCTGKTSSSISMAFDVDWGGEPSDGNRDSVSTLRDSSNTQIQVIRNGGTSATFTGLTRYTPYYIVAYACNSAGGNTPNGDPDGKYSPKVLVYTDPEKPKINTPTISNLARLSVTVTPGFVTDDGGKTITEVETYIKGGAYGDTLTSIGKGTGAKNVTGLEPNTKYHVVTRATNGITENYSSYTSFYTLGDPPVITDVYATNVTPTGSKIQYTATYDHNAYFSSYKVEWKYPSSSTWTALETSTNTISGVSNLNTDEIQYRITVTDNWNRSTTSATLNYVMLQDLTNEVSDLTIVKNVDKTYTITGTWSQKLYNKITGVNIYSQEFPQRSPEITKTSSFTNTGFSATTKKYLNDRLEKRFSIEIYYTCSPGSHIVKGKTIAAIDYPKAINTKNKSGNLVEREFYTITKNQKENSTEIKRLRQHDIIKLSRFMRYIQLDSRGVEPNILVSSVNNYELEISNRFTIRYSYEIRHKTGKLYSISITKLEIKSNKIRRVRNNTLCLSICGHSSLDGKSLQSWYLPNMTVNTSWQSIDCSLYYDCYFIPSITSLSSTLNTTISFECLNEFDFVAYSNSKDHTSSTITAVDSDLVNNHICKIQVFDKNGTNIALNKTLRLVNGESPTVYNSCNPTDSSVVNTNKYVCSQEGSPLFLDLGAEYEISKIKVWRRFNNDNDKRSYQYYRNYIYGRNVNNELCYIFFDSERDGQYKEESTGKEFKIN